MRRILRLRERPGLSWAELCEETGVPMTTLRYYAARFKTEDEAKHPVTGFVEALAAPANLRTDPILELVVGEGHVIRVPLGFDSDHLSRLLAVLESRC